MFSKLNIDKTNNVYLEILASSVLEKEKMQVTPD